MISLVNGNWGNWMQWSACSVSCEEGRKTRSRNCDDPAPANGGTPCQGKQNEIEQCTERAKCPQDGGWGWTEWSECRSPCNDDHTGNRRRNRVCNNPPPEQGGKNCPEDVEMVDYQKCELDLCDGRCLKSMYFTGDNLQIDKKPPWEAGADVQNCKQTRKSLGMVSERFSKS